MAQCWRTKEDVLNDLALASGHKVTDVDDACFLYGEQPPPPRAGDDEDDEFELRFGRATSERQKDGTGPDLIGITNMLRMVHKYENSSDDELPVTPNKQIIISKANTNQGPSAEKTRLSIGRYSLMSPNKNNNLSSKKGSSEKNTSNSDINSGKEISPSKMNLRKRSDKTASHSELNLKILPSLAKVNDEVSSEEIASKKIVHSSLLQSPAKIITNIGTITSKLNPNVKEFIPKSTRIATSPICKVTEENFNDSHSNKKMENEINDPKISNNDKNEDCSKDMKKQMAMMLKNQISAKNDTFKDQQQTNRAIVNLLKLYADPKPAKPLKLLTPHFFEKCKATDFEDNIKEPNKIGHTTEKMTSLRNVKEVSVGMSLCSSQDSNRESIESMPMALGHSKNYNRSAVLSTYKGQDKERKNKNITLQENSSKERSFLMENKLTLSKDNSDTFVDKTNDTDEFREYNMTSKKDINNSYSNQINSSKEIKGPIETNIVFKEDINNTYKHSDDEFIYNNMTFSEDNDYNDKNNDFDEFKYQNMSFSDNTNNDYNDKNKSLEEYIEKKITFNKGINDVYYKNNEEFKENNQTFNNCNNNVCLMKKNDNNEFEETNRAICKENDDIEEFKEVEATQLTPDMGDMNIDESNTQTGAVKLDPEMEESISKVNNWLHDKPVVTMSEKSKSQMLYLGAIGYKRKDPVTCKSPSETTETKVPKVTEYKPSSYAAQLHKKYSEKSKTHKDTPTMNIWDKLEADLKKRDLEVMNRKKKA